VLCQHTKHFSFQRERVADLNKWKELCLNWSEWVKVVVPNKPRGFIRSRTLNAYTRKAWFSEGFGIPSIYEVAVTTQTKLNSKKHVMYYRMSTNGFRRSGTWCANILRHKTVREECTRALGNGLAIYVRRGIPRGKTEVARGNQMNAASDILRDHFDYAWKKYVWRKSSDGSQKHRLVTVKRNKMPLTLSHNDI